MSSWSSWDWTQLGEHTSSWQHKCTFLVFAASALLRFSLSATKNWTLNRSLAVLSWLYILCWLLEAHARIPLPLPTFHWKGCTWNRRNNEITPRQNPPCPSTKERIPYCHLKENAVLQKYTSNTFIFVNISKTLALNTYLSVVQISQSTTKFPHFS